MKNSITKKIKDELIDVKYKLVILVALSSVIVVSGIGRPWIISKYFDIGIKSGKWDTLLKYNGALFGLILISFINGIIYKYIFGYISNRFVVNIKKYIISHLYRIPFEKYKKTNIGDIITRINNDVQEINNYIMSTILGSCESILDFIGASIYISITEWRMLVLNIVVLPIMILSIMIYKKYIYSYSLEIKKARSIVNNKMIEGLRGLYSIKSVGLDEYYLKIVSNKFEKLFKSNIRYSVLSALSNSTTNLISAAGMIMTLVYGGWLIINGELTIGVLLAFITLRSKLTSPIKIWTRILGGYFGVKSSIERLNEIVTLDEEPGIYLNNGIKINKIETLSIKEVEFKYKESRNIIKFSMDAEKGEWIGIIGRSGAGKTTIIDLITKISIPLKGSVQVNGININKINNTVLRREIAYLPQNKIIFSDSIKGNILIGRNSKDDKQIWDIIRLSGFEEDVLKMENGIYTEIGDNGNKLSEGMKNRLLLARALFEIESKSILVIDEALSSIDENSSNKIVEELKMITHDKIVIVITHRNNELSKCDRIYSV